MAVPNNNDKLVKDVVRVLTVTGPRYYAAVAVLAAIAFFGLIVWINQVMKGLDVTGMSNSVAWGVYITNFVFFIGISLAGTLISAVLHITHAEWRRPITRAAEAVTVFALIFAMISILVDIGHPERFLNLFLFGPAGSPMIWDIFIVTMYLISSAFYLYLSMIPDLAIMRDVFPAKSWRGILYKILALGWEDTAEQKRKYKKAVSIIVVLIMPVAIMVHTVTAFIFGVTIRPGWHSTILGPYFVVTALFSGLAVISVALAVLRKVFKLENYLKPAHFSNLGKLLAIMSALWLYVTFAEFLTSAFAGHLHEMYVITSKLYGDFAIPFWGMIFCVAASFVVLIIKKINPIARTVIAAVFITIAVWLERFLIIVPALTQPLSEGHKGGIYHVSFSEIFITTALLAGFILCYFIFVKLFPVI